MRVALSRVKPFVTFAVLSLFGLQNAFACASDKTEKASVIGASATPHLMSSQQSFSSNEIAVSLPVIPWSMGKCGEDYKVNIDGLKLAISDNTTGRNFINVYDGHAHGETACQAWIGSGTITLYLFQGTTQLPQSILVDWQMGGKSNNNLPVPFVRPPRISDGKPLSIDITKITQVKVGGGVTYFVLDVACSQNPPPSTYSCNSYGCSDAWTGGWTFGY
jgi:hypothetical protein